MWSKMSTFNKKQEIKNNFGFNKNITKQSGVSSIAKVNNVSLSYRDNRFSETTLRDKFTNFLRAPIQYLQAPPSMHLALDNVSFEVNQGERVGILGVNGSGKTSLCRCLAKMITPSSGSIEVLGEVRPIFSTSIGIIPLLSGRENIQLLTYLLFPKLSNLEKKEIINEAVEFCELGEFIDSPYQHYSKGMQARVSLSVITSRPSELLILDEVFDGADEYFKAKMSERVLGIIEKSGAVVFVSHNRDQIEKVCNKLIIINAGKIIYNGDLYNGFRKYDEVLSNHRKSKC